MFIAYPFFNGLFISTESYNFLRPDRTQFVGLQNYINLFTPDSVQFQPFWTSLWNTVQFVIYSVPPLVVIPLGLAVLLNIKIPGRTLWAIYFAPWVLSIAVVGLLWWWIFNSQGGLINYYLGQLHLPQPEWLSTLPWAWVSIQTPEHDADTTRQLEELSATGRIRWERLAVASQPAAMNHAVRSQVARCYCFWMTTLCLRRALSPHCGKLR